MMKMQHLGILFLFFSSLVSAKEMNLEDYLTEVKNANPLVRLSQLRAKALSYRVKPAGTMDDPFFAGGIDEKSFDGSMAPAIRYQLSQTVPFPGKLRAKTEIAEFKAKSAQSNSETLQREITVLATQAFYRFFYNQQSLLLNEKLINIVRDTVESTKARYKSGENGHHEWLLAKVELSVFEVERVKLLRDQKTFLAVLNELRDQPSETPVSILPMPFSDADLLTKELPSLDNQPELKSLDSIILQAESEKRLAKLSYFPDFVFQAMAMYPSPDMPEEKSNWGFMIGVNIPLYFWRKQSEIYTAASIEKDVAVIQRKNLSNRLNTESVDAKEQFEAAKHVVALYKNTVIPITNLAVQNAKIGYASRRFPLQQYLDILKTQRIQELEYLAAQIDMVLARTRLTELLSSPPLLRFAPSKPSLFGGGQMGGTSMGSDTINMGNGMSGPTRTLSEPSESAEIESSGMGNM